MDERCSIHWHETDGPAPTLHLELEGGRHPITALVVGDRVTLDLDDSVAKDQAGVDSWEVMTLDQWWTVPQAVLKATVLTLRRMTRYDEIRRVDD